MPPKVFPSVARVGGAAPRRGPVPPLDPRRMHRLVTTSDYSAASRSVVMQVALSDIVVRKPSAA